MKMKRKPHLKPIDLSGSDFEKVMKAMLQTPPPPSDTVRMEKKTTAQRGKNA